MCRHLAQLSSKPFALEHVLVPFVDQARSPQHQSSGHTNPDGWGAGWYDEHGAAQRYRTATPMWEDGERGAIASSVCTTAAVIAARLASPGSPVEETGSAPFTDGRHLFSLNGIVAGHHDGVGEELRALVTPARLDGITGAADSEVLFAMVLDRLDAGATLGEALAGVVVTVDERTTGSRLNLLLTDGERIAATAWGNSLFLRNGDTAVVASEPLDDDPSWSRITDHALVEGDVDALSVTPL